MGEMNQELQEVAGVEEYWRQEALKNDCALRRRTVNGERLTLLSCHLDLCFHTIRRHLHREIECLNAILEIRTCG